MDFSTFYPYSAWIINNLEGGYFHPDMFKDGRLPPNENAMRIYRTSGETLFGLDRRAGHDLFYEQSRIDGTLRFKDADSYYFWHTLDTMSSRYRIPWNSRLGAYGNYLSYIASRIMYKQFASYSNKYLDPVAFNNVLHSAYLTVVMIYATWNGPGFFRTYARIINSYSKLYRPSEAVNYSISSIRYLKSQSKFSQIKQTGMLISKRFPS